MDCAEEVSLLRASLSRLAGVGELRFDVLTARMDVDYDASRLEPAQIEHAVSAIGMHCEPWGRAAKQRGLWEQHWRQWLTWLSGIALLCGMAVQTYHSGDLVRSLLVHEHGHHDLPWTALLSFWIAIAAGSIHALPKAWGSLRILRPDMNLLVVMSLLGASVLGEWTEAATLSFLFAVAAQLETWSLGRAREAISRLLEFSPPEATLLHSGTTHGKEDHGEHEHRVPAEQISLGSLIRVRPGERLPFDGVVERGASFVNQALITGESVPVEKIAGDEVFAGTMNENGVLDIRTTREASDTTIARMIRMVEDSRIRRAPSEQFVEKFTRYYTPAVFLLAFSIMVLPPLFRGGGWVQWFYEGMVILLISCPCALVISTPVSIVAALTSAARHGLLIKGGAFLEEAAKIRAFALDKTGVVTRGVPQVDAFVPLNGHGERQVLERLVSLELSSEHPLARAILRFAEENGVHALPASGFRAVQGRGAEASEDGGTFWVGSARMMREKGLDGGDLERRMDELAATGRSVMVCGESTPQGCTPWALVAVLDPVRPEAADAVRELRQAGIERVIMLTGDNRQTANTLAAAIGVDEVHAELLPADKSNFVLDMLRSHRHVAMVGDGVNDAQALSQASLGIGMGHRGADITRETADVVLMNSDLSTLVFLVHHAKRTMRVIKENIGFALATKLLFLAAAMAGLATLWMAVAADMGATFLVTLNGLRLLRSRPQRTR
jgi:Zn2+/Cd2+-exporting ATPase